MTMMAIRFAWLLLAGGSFLLNAATARPSADWVKAGVIYEINPRAFSAAGGFRAITAALDDLKRLGVTILWLMPVQPSGQERKKGSVGSPYAVRDYYAINPDYGSEQDLKELVRESHRRGFRIILDVVANHTAWDSVLMKTPDFYKHDAQGNIIAPVPDWADVAALDYSNPRVADYMIAMLKHWLREFDFDGFRCDVAGMVPTSFWVRARTEIETVKPDIIMLAEWHSGDLLEKAFDLDYAWPFHKTLTEVMTLGAPATALRAVWEEERAKFPRGAMELRFTDNHDEERAIARFGKRGALAAAALVFTFDGVPLVYNGMEAGDSTESGAPALFEKVPVLWQFAERRPEFRSFFTEIIALRRAHPALQQGETEWLENSDSTRIVTYLRRAAGEEFLVAVNLSNRPFDGGVEVAGDGFREVTPGVAGVLSLPRLSLKAWEYRIFLRK